MIISIRGTNGSGKSTVVRELMRCACTCSPLYGVLGLRKPEAYRLELSGQRTYVLGPYDTRSACGFDGITNYDHQPALIRKYAVVGHVVFEGLISSKLWGRVGAVFEELAPVQGVALLFLTTPLEECIRRVVERRCRAGDERIFNDKNLRAVYDACRGNLTAVRRKQIKGVAIHEVPSEEAATLCLRLLGGA